MALTLSKIGITDGQVITAAQITQSIDALTGAAAYDITISGSFALIGTTGSGTFNRALRSQQVENDTSIPLTNRYYNVALFNSTSSTSTVLKYSGTGPSFNPVTETLKVTNLEGTASFVVSASYAQTASYALNAATPSFNYVGIDDVTYTSSAVPFPVTTGTQYDVYISQSGVPSSNRLALRFQTGTDGQIVNFTPSWQNTDLDLTRIEITASANVFGLSGNTIPASTANTANNLLTAINNVKNLTFQYVATPSATIFPQAGWYLLNNNTI